MKKYLLACSVLGLGWAGCDKKPAEAPADPPAQTAAATTGTAAQTAGAPEEAPAKAELGVTPLQHASMLLEIDGLTIAVDPVAGAYEAAKKPIEPVDVVLVTDIHGDHLDADTVVKLTGEKTIVVAPQAVVDTDERLKGAKVLANGEKADLLEGKLGVEAVPMYNIERKREDSGEPYHVKGRGNGYILTAGGQRIYLSGDTECIPEMKALESIDIAFVCMNLPYTMTPEEAATCIAEFKPKKLYPYHHRDQDPTKLNGLLADSGVEIELLNWYPAAEAEK